MDMLEFLVGKEGGEDKGVIGSPLRPSGLPGLGGELSHERARILLAAYNAKASLVGVGITAMQVFGRDVPDQIHHPHCAPRRRVQADRVLPQGPYGGNRTVGCTRCRHDRVGIVLLFHRPHDIGGCGAGRFTSSSDHVIEHHLGNPDAPRRYCPRWRQTGIARPGRCNTSVLRRP